MTDSDRRIDELERRVNELEERLSTRFDAVEATQFNHSQTDRDAFNELHAKIGEVQTAIAAVESAHEANSMAQMHVLGLVARKVGVSAKEMRKVKVII